MCERSRTVPVFLGAVPPIVVLLAMGVLWVMFLGALPIMVGSMLYGGAGPARPGRMAFSAWRGDPSARDRTGRAMGADDDCHDDELRDGRLTLTFHVCEFKQMRWKGIRHVHPIWESVRWRTRRSRVAIATVVGCVVGGAAGFGWFMLIRRLWLRAGASQESSESACTTTSSRSEAIRSKGPY